MSITPAEEVTLSRASLTSQGRFPEPGVIVLRGGDALFFNEHVLSFYFHVLENWESSEKYIALYMGCSNRKPFSKSFVHMKLMRMLKSHDLDNFVQQFIVSEPLAVCPRELEETFPAANYDFPPEQLGEKGREEFVTRLRTFLQKRAKKMYEIHVGFMPNHHKRIFLEASAKLLEPLLIPYNVYQLPRLLRLLEDLKVKCRR
jgi:hypothetical protein